MVPYNRPIRLLPVLDTSAVIEVCTLGRFQRSNTSTETQHDRLVQYWRQTPHSIQIALLSMCTKSYMRAVSIHCIRLMERGPKRRENAQEATMVPSAGRTSHTEILHGHIGTINTKVYANTQVPTLSVAADHDIQCRDDERRSTCYLSNDYQGKTNWNFYYFFLLYFFYFISFVFVSSICYTAVCYSWLHHSEDWADSFLGGKYVTDGHLALDLV
jgi:hypothetical protein